MEILSKGLILGKFVTSEYGLTVASFSYNGNSEDEIGMGATTVEEFVGHNPVPVYLGEKYTDKLNLQVTLVKDPSIFHNNLYFYEKDCRSILRLLTGLKGYQWLKLIDRESEEDLWYRARINNVSYKRVGGHIVGIVLNLECDSCFAWSRENSITIHAKANQCFYIYNSTDDLNNYVLPVVSIAPFSAGTIRITNISDSRASEIRNVKSGEKITVDSRRQIISSNLNHESLLDDFNLGWFRLVPEKNEYVADMDAVISFKYRVPRKVGIVG